ncbi:MAG: hypothetical protein AABX07_01000 [Nanoarchaeota archaeon]
MLPKWHIFYGALFTLFLWIIAPTIKIIDLALIFLASFLIDIDHYLCAVFDTKKMSLKNALNYYEEIKIRTTEERRKGIRKKGNFHLFHTIEFHVLIAMLGIFWLPFLYVFIGMVFHSLLDLFYMSKRDYLYHREFFFVNWLMNIYANKKSQKAYKSLSQQNKSRSP